MNYREEIKNAISEDKDILRLEVAQRVYESLAEDGVYGPYALGEDLWNEFESKFKEDKQ